MTAADELFCAETQDFTEKTEAIFRQAYDLLSAIVYNLDLMLLATSTANNRMSDII